MPRVKICSQQEEHVHLSEVQNSVQEIEENTSRIKFQVITDLKNNPGIWDSQLAEYTNKAKRQ